jgi:hypothetical protein
MDNRIRKHWIIYYRQRKSLVSDNMLMDEERRVPIPRGLWNDPEGMFAFARANANRTETHFAIGKAIEPGARRIQQMLTEILPCR